LADGQLNIPKESDVMATNDRKVERWKLSRLKENPLQREVFAGPAQHEVEELAADMKANGQTTPVEALPDGTLIAGHKRRLAAELLGLKELDVWVRYDLAADPAAAERRLIEDNLHRRQLGPLGLARCYKRLKVLGSMGLDGRLLDYEQRDLRDRLGERLNVSGRSLDRYLRVLEHTLPEVQAAFEAGTLPLTLAEQVAGLGEEQQAEIAKRLRAGAEPKVVVRRFLAAAPRRAKNVTEAKKLLVRALTRARADLRGRLRTLRWITTADEKAFRRGRRLLRRLLEQAQAARADDAELDDLMLAEEVDLEADEAEGGPADASRPDNLAGGRVRRPGRDGNGKESKISSTPGGGRPAGGPAPGKAAGRRTARKPGRSRPAGAKKGRTRP
jgi:ParB-like chromosome segregation protein Spo0J